MTAISLKRAPIHYADIISTAPILWNSNTTIVLAPGQYRDSTNSVDIILPPNGVTIDQTVNGINGLDSGTLISTWYYVYVVGDSTGYLPSGGVISTSGNAPTLPFSYDVYKLIGFVHTASSTLYFTKFYLCGTGNTKLFMHDSKVQVMNGGTSATFATVSLISGVPTYAVRKEVLLNYTFTPSSANNIFQIRPTGSSATTVLTIQDPTNVWLGGEISVITNQFNGTPCIDYLVSSGASLTLDVLGFRYSI
jgi:hypothetical protein